MKYIVTWLIIKTVEIICPTPPPIVDEFGRKFDSTYQIIETCYGYDTTNMQKFFDTRKEANDFIKRGTDAKSQGYVNEKVGVLSNFKLDSIPKIQYDCKHELIMVTAMGCLGGDPCNTATCERCGKQWKTY